MFSIRIHGALEVIAGQLFDGEYLLEAVLWAFVLTRARRGAWNWGANVPENVVQRRAMQTREVNDIVNGVK